MVSKIMDCALLGHRISVLVNPEGEVKAIATHPGTYLHPTAFHRTWVEDYRKQLDWRESTYEEAITALRLYFSKRHRIPVNHLKWAEIDETFVH